MGRHRPLLMATACLASLFPASFGAHAQAPAANQTQTTDNSQFKCPRGADPRRRQHGCNDQVFDLDETLARHWNELRKEMQRIGITPTASYVGALQTNATGGRDQVWSYAGQLTVGLSTNFEELLKIPGLSAYVDFSWGTGSNLTGSIDSAIPTNGLYAPSFYLGEMYLQESLLKKRLSIIGGRIAAGDAFAALPVFTNYVTYGINPNPFSLPANDFTFPGPPPGTEWGVQAGYSVTTNIQLEAGAFNTNLNSANGENHGADFAFQEGNKGVLAIAQVDYLRNQRATSTGMPGQISAGFLRNNNSFPNLDNPQEQSNGYHAVYVVGQQMVFRPDGPGTTRGATVWGSWSSHFKDIVNPIPLFWGGGVSYEGLIPARKHDIVSACVIHTEASRYALPANTEEVVELNYQWNHSRYLTIMPHAQYQWQHGPPQNRNATILGLQVAVTF